MLTLISIARALVEMIGLCLIGQAILHLLAGNNRNSNPIYRLFELVTRPPRALVSMLVGAERSGVLVHSLAFFISLALWIALALLRKYV